MSSTRKAVGSVVLASAICVWFGSPGWAQENSLSLNLGRFAVQGADTRIYDDVINENLGLFAFDLDQFNSVSVGADWLLGAGDYMEIGFGVAFTQQTVPSVYLDYVDYDGFEIPQEFKLRITPLTSTSRFFPFGRRSAVQPYAGMGVGYFNWRYSEVGEFIDFDTFDFFRDTFTATGNDVGVVYLAGLRVLAGDVFGAGVEMRYQDVSGEVGIEQGFLDDRIDLGGLTSSVTFHVRF